MFHVAVPVFVEFSAYFNILVSFKEEHWKDVLERLKGILLICILYNLIDLYIYKNIVSWSIASRIVMFIDKSYNTNNLHIQICN